MALSGLQIYKLLPQTNCKDCGFPTCLAFAMKLAQKGTELEKCPHVSDESKAALDAASAPPIKLVKVGAGARAFEVGNEVVMYRHEKTFYHQPGIVARVVSDDPELAAKATAAADYSLERVGMELRLDGLAIKQAEGQDAAAYAAAVAAAHAAAPELPLVLASDEAAAIEAALAGVAAAKPLIWGANADNWQAMAALAKQHGCPLVLKGEVGSLDELVALSDQVRGAGVEDLILDAGTATLAGDLSLFTQLRRLALKKGERRLGFPLLADAVSDNWQGEVARAAQAIAKYAGVVVIDHVDPRALTTLLTLRQNIYTDTQKPM